MKIPAQGRRLLNCQPHDVPVLVAARLLKPLGNPPANSVKFFAALELLEQVKDRAWLAKVTNALNQHWQKKNAAKRNGALNGSAVTVLVPVASANRVADIVRFLQIQYSCLKLT